MLPTGITEVIQLSSEPGGEPLPVVADLAEEQLFVHWSPVTVGMQLNINPSRRNLGELTGRHQLQHAQTQDLCIVYAQVAGDLGREFVFLRGCIVLPAGKLEKRLPSALSVFAGGQSEHT